MPTQCNQDFLEFHPLDQRQVRGGFDGGAITSDAGGLLLREVGSGRELSSSLRPVSGTSGRRSVSSTG